MSAKKDKNAAIDDNVVDETSTVPRDSEVKPSKTSVFMGGISLKFPGLEAGLRNLARLPELDPENPKVMPLSDYNESGITFGRDGKIVLSGGNNNDSVVSTKLFVAMVDKMFVRQNNGHVIELQQYSPSDTRSAGRPQVIGHINPEFSVITIIHGMISRGVIRSAQDISTQFHYYVSREEMAVFYCAAKLHLLNIASDLITGANRGIIEFDIPRNPMRQETGVQYGGE